VSSFDVRRGEFVKIGFQPVTKKFAKIAFLFEVIVVDIVAEYSGGQIRTILYGFSLPTID
jgi:hypothetical protein